MNQIITQFLIDETHAYSAFQNVKTDSSQVKELLCVLRESSMKNCDIAVTDSFYSNTFQECNVSDFFFSSDVMEGENRDDILEFCRLFENFTEFSSTSDDTPPGYDFIGFNKVSVDIGLITKTDYNGENWWDEQRFKCICQIYRPLDHHRYCVQKSLANNESLFWEIVDDLFPNLYFNKDTSRLKFSNLSVMEHDFFKWIVESFSYLNDLAVKDYQSNPKDFKARASAQGLDLSPESPNTHRCKKKMMARNIEINGEEVCCEWHVKYKYDKGRIHFHVGQNLSSNIKKYAGDKLIIGIVCDHLPT